MYIPDVILVPTVFMVLSETLLSLGTLMSSSFTDENLVSSPTVSPTVSAMGVVNNSRPSMLWRETKGTWVNQSLGFNHRVYISATPQIHIIPLSVCNPEAKHILPDATRATVCDITSRNARNVPSNLSTNYGHLFTDISSVFQYIQRFIMGHTHLFLRWSDFNVGPLNLLPVLAMI